MDLYKSMGDINSRVREEVLKIKDIVVPEKKDIN